LNKINLVSSFAVRPETVVGFSSRIADSLDVKAFS